MSAPRPFYWSVRRELWENRSIYVAPLAVAAVVLLGFAISLVRCAAQRCVPPRRSTWRCSPRCSPSRTLTLAMLLIATAFLVAIFYCLDALHGERRDRSILFWKSLPVSDLTTVLSKAIIPLVILPLIIFVITVVTQLIMLLMSSVVLLASGAECHDAVGTVAVVPDVIGAALPLLAVLALWHAPIYAWLLLVSGWARRAAFLWAVLPLVAIGVFERIAFHTSYFGSLMHDRVGGFAAHAFALRQPGSAPLDPHFIPLALIAPGKFLTLRVCG